MTKDLTFTKQENGRYAAEYVSSGFRSVVQMARESAGEVIVYMRVPGMADWGASPIYYNVSRNFMFEVNVPSGIEIKVESFTEVLTGKLLEE